MAYKILSKDVLQVIGDLPLDRAEKIMKLRTRDWAFIVYPDSAPENWLDLVRDRLLPFSVSPLHDKDFNAHGEPKKPHYHVLICCDGVKSFSQLAEIAVDCNGTNLINVDSARGYYRYFLHLDNPEKAQYREVDIRWFNGFDPKLYDKPTSIQRYNMIEEMQEYIDKRHITNYAVFVREIRRTHYEWFKLLCDNSTNVIAAYIKAVRYLPEDEKERQAFLNSAKHVENSINTGTGEIERTICDVLDYSNDNLPFNSK